MCVVLCSVNVLQKFTENFQSFIHKIEKCPTESRISPRGEETDLKGSTNLSCNRRTAQGSFRDRSSLNRFCSTKASLILEQDVRHVKDKQTRDVLPLAGSHYRTWENACWLAVLITKHLSHFPESMGSLCLVIPHPEHLLLPTPHLPVTSSPTYPSLRRSQMLKNHSNTDNGDLAKVSAGPHFSTTGSK